MPKSITYFQLLLSSYTDETGLRQICCKRCALRKLAEYGVFFERVIFRKFVDRNAFCDAFIVSRIDNKNKIKLPLEKELDRMSTG